MVKRKEINVIHFVLTLFVYLAPILGSGFDKNAVVYTSLFAFFGALCYSIYKRGSVFITKTFLFLSAVATVAFLQLILVSDKGGQFYFASLFLTAALAGVITLDYKMQLGEDKTKQVACRVLYSATLVYAVVAILYQIFIETRFLGTGMNFGNGSSAFTACLMVTGVIAGVNMFKKQKKTPEFIVAILIMAYVFIMAKSLLGYLFAFLVMFAYTMRAKHKRVEAFISLVGIVVFALLNGIIVIANLVRDGESFNGAMKGLVSIMGVGCGGYNAASSVIDRGYAGFAPTLNLMLESLGILGLIVVILAFAGAINLYRKTRSFADLIAVFALFVMMFSSSASLVFMLPMMAMYYAIATESVEIRLNGFLGFILVIPSMFYLIIASSNVCFALGKGAYDVGNYEDAAQWYSNGAKIEMFSSRGWERAYDAAYKGFEAGNASTAIQKEYLENAIKFNTKNYRYRRLLADVYTNEGDYVKALEIWDGIIARYDREYLYPMYAQKIYDVMANCQVGLEKIEELYKTLDNYAQKTADKDIKLEVNNILAKSQEYYINAREGTQTAAEMYTNITDVTEVEDESGNSES